VNQRCRSSVVLCLLATATLAQPLAAAKLAVGIVPFDVETVDGASPSSGEALAKLVRIEMIKSARLQPTVLGSAKTTEEAAKAGAAAKSDIVVVGTVLSVDTSGGETGANSGSLLGGAIGVGGRLRRTTTHVELHIELVNPKTGDIVDTFEVEGKNSETGVGGDFSTALGGVDSDAGGLDRSSIGKALREAAQKITAEVTKRADRLVK
jgi:curli production assembly/transport component CsgG